MHLPRDPAPTRVRIAGAMRIGIGTMTHTTRADKAFEILNQNEDDNVDLVEFAKAIPKFEAIGVLSHD